MNTTQVEFVYNFISFLFIGTALSVMRLVPRYTVIDHQSTIRRCRTKQYRTLFNLPIEVLYVQFAITRCDETSDPKQNRVYGLSYYFYFIDNLDHRFSRL